MDTKFTHILVLESNELLTNGATNFAVKSKVNFQDDKNMQPL